jgi:limonene-1,2-epoxide hydrolase
VDHHSSAEANDALVRAFMAAWELRDSDFILEHLSDDAVYHSIPLSPIIGKAAVGAWVKAFEGRPGGRLEIHHQVASGEIVMNERTDVIVLNGRTVTLPICAVFEVRAGRVYAWREYFDSAPARAAYGLA